MCKHKSAIIQIEPIDREAQNNYIDSFTDIKQVYFHIRMINVVCQPNHFAWHESCASSCRFMRSSMRKTEQHTCLIDQLTPHWQLHLISVLVLAHKANRRETLAHFSHHTNKMRSNVRCVRTCVHSSGLHSARASLVQHPCAQRV